MESKMNEMGNGKNGRLGIIGNLGLPLRLPGFNVKTMPGFAEPAYRTSEACRNHLTEMECQRANARAEVQRFQLNR